MTKNPFLNALAAELYIIAIAAVMAWGTRYAPQQDTFLAPVAVISLFTLSAAIMGYVFCFTPLILYVENKKKQAVMLFLRTVGAFGILTLISLALLFSGTFR